MTWSLFVDSVFHGTSMVRCSIYCTQSIGFMLIFFFQGLWFCWNLISVFEAQAASVVTASALSADMGETFAQWNLVQLAFIAVFPAYIAYIRVVNGQYVRLSVHLSLSLTVNGQSLHLSVHLSVSLTVNGQSIHLWVHLSVSLTVNGLSVHLSVCPSVSITVNGQSLHLSVHLSLSQTVNGQYVCL